MSRSPRFFVDARRSVGFDTLEQAKEFARVNFPAVILERKDLPDGTFEWREVLRYDWRWDPIRQRPEIDFA